MRKLNIENDPEIEKLDDIESKRVAEDKVFEEKEISYKQNKGNKDSVDTKDTEYTDNTAIVEDNYPKKNKVDKKRLQKIGSVNNTKKVIQDSFSNKRRRNSSGGINLKGSGDLLFYIILFMVIAVLFKWVILKNPGYTAVAMFVIIIVFVGHLRDK